jgi:hypothetical protein
VRTCLALLISLVSTASFAESIACTNDFTLSSAVGVRKGNSGDDHYQYEAGMLHEVYDGRTLWSYSIVSEKDGLIVGALRQQEHASDCQVVLIDRRNKTLMKTVVQGNLRFTTFGPCTFGP